MPARGDPQFFTGTLWIMGSGAWQVRVFVEGGLGDGALSVPVTAVASRTGTMGSGLGTVLLALTLLLASGLVAIVAASVREGQTPPDEAPGPDRKRRARIAAVLTAATVGAVLVLGNAWWGAEAAEYRRYVYKPLEADAEVEPVSRLVLRLRDPGWFRGRLMDDFVPDHGHLMHLFVVRTPDLDRIWHLHPEMETAGVFAARMPAMPPGRYRIFADVVHDSGLPETIVTELSLAVETAGVPLAGDDSAGLAPAAAGEAAFVAEDGTRIVWERGRDPLMSRRATHLRFRVEDREGRPAGDLGLYMGMPGHALVLRRDLSVFAHVHPEGSPSMAALELARASLAETMGATPSLSHGDHDARAAPSPRVSFPYGFPRAGDYRIFVQVKRAGRIITATFDATVLESGDGV
jgi:hypothetical protein